MKKHYGLLALTLYTTAKGLNLHDIIWVPKELIRLLRQKKEILKNIQLK